MKNHVNLILLIVPALVLLIIPVGSEQTKSVVVTTSMLECAAREVTPVSEKIELIRLLPPSACPGHFDLSPRVIPGLRSAVMVLRHDYQDILDKKLSDMGVEDISLIAVSTEGSPLIPAHYHELVTQVQSQFAIHFPDCSGELVERGEAVKNRTNTLTESIRKRAAPWKGKPIIAAVHQKEFCEWLGFEIAGVLKRPEDTSPRDLEKLLAVRADMVVANIQEGVQGANFLGERMNIPVAVLSNFPGAEGFGESYDALLEKNMKRLEEAWRKR